MWDSASDTGISFNLDDLPSSSSSSSFLSSLLPSTDLSALSELAYIVENNVILSAITNQLAQTDVEVRYNSKVKSYDLPNNNTHTGGLDEKLPTVELENGEKYTAKLLVKNCFHFLYKTFQIHHLSIYDFIYLVVYYIISFELSKILPQIGADGSNSLLRKTSNIKTIGAIFKTFYILIFCLYFSI